jgi:hypothetical protein
MSESREEPLPSLPEPLRQQARDRLDEVTGRIARAARRAGRAPEEITLVGVAKRQPLERILASLAAGLRVLGESYIQEAREVRPAIEAALAGDAVLAGTRLEWHMVGRLQRNKVGLATRLFDTIETVDRPELAATLARRAASEGRTLDVLIQVSLCGEPQKGGCEPGELAALARLVLASEGLRLAGMMTIPAAHEDPEAARPAFRALRELRGELARLDPALASAALSMGMSHDLEVAVEEGATLVRVGTALFGDRVEPR